MIRSSLNEGNGINQKALRPLQSGETQGQVVRDLRQSQAQAAARLGG
jgi:outer membrane protein assembly factor BamE (lipoprotein component of BamABCDE complex)